MTLCLTLLYAFFSYASAHLTTFGCHHKYSELNYSTTLFSHLFVDVLCYSIAKMNHTSSIMFTKSHQDTYYFNLK